MSGIYLLLILAIGSALALLLALGVCLLHSHQRRPVALGSFSVEFVCDDWHLSGGACCPDGTVSPDCPALRAHHRARSAACPARA